jgi:aldehyde dehydrogenase (NAD+)
LAAGGERPSESSLSKGNFYRPTVFAGVAPDARIAVEEIFGPVLAVVKVKNLDEAVRINNASRYGLSSSIFTADVNRAFAAMRDLDTGIVYVNHGTTGAETHLPFGGTRGTGNGHREAGHTMLDPFTEWKSVYVDFRAAFSALPTDNNQGTDEPARMQAKGLFARYRPPVPWSGRRRPRRPPTSPPRSAGPWCSRPRC